MSTSVAAPGVPGPEDAERLPGRAALDDTEAAVTLHYAHITPTPPRRTPPYHTKYHTGVPYAYTTIP
jgi:hypothetical protein